jgi:membrane associated rhomboid family serine protease
MSFGPAFTPPVIQYLIIANLVVFMAQFVVPYVDGAGALRPIAFWQGGFFWQPFTYMWLHGGIGHILMNMFMLWMFGSQVAMAWGPKRFLRYYLLCGVGAGLIIASWPYLLYGLGLMSPFWLGIGTVGASGAIYGVILAYSLTWPERTIALIIPPVTFKAIWLIPILFVSTLLFAGGNVSHVGHLGGVLVGWIYMRRNSNAPNPLSIENIKYRIRRFRMRRKLRAVQYEEFERRREENERRNGRMH